MERNKWGRKKWPEEVRQKLKEPGTDRKSTEYYQIRSRGIVELLNTVQIGLRITLVSKTERETPQLIH